MRPYDPPIAPARPTADAPPSSAPAVSVVVVTYRSRSTIAGALDPLAGACAEGFAECIVVDNASDDGTADVVEEGYPWAQLVRSRENRGYGSACNLGAASARGDFLLLLNPDATISAESLRCLHRFLEEHPAAAIAAPAIRIGSALERVRDFPTPVRLLRDASGRLLRRWRPSAVIEPGGPPFRAGWCSGAVLLVRRHAFDLVGGFDPRFFLYFEDVDLSLRIAQAGGEIWAVGEAYAEHAGSVSARTAGEPLYCGCIASHYFRSRLVYLEKHFGRRAAVAAELTEWMVSLARDLYRRLAFRDPDPELRTRLAEMRIADLGLRGESNRPHSALRTRAVPVLLCVDVEPDLRRPSRIEPERWAGYERCYDLLCRWRARLAESSGCPARFTWFFRMDPQIEESYGDAAWAVVRYPEFVDVLRANGDAFGLHVHSFRWDSDRSVWVNDCADQDWVEHCVRSAFGTYEAAFGRRCGCFRYGDRWMNDATAALLEELGVRVDLTLEPGFGAEPVVHPGEPFAGAHADHRDLPTVPYRPSRRDHRVPDPLQREGLWIFPLTTARSERLRGRLLRLGRQLVAPSRRLWPMYTTLKLNLAPEVFRRVLRRSLGAKPPYLTAVMRTDDAVRLPDWVEENLEHLASYGDRFAYVTAEERIETSTEY